MNDHNPLRAKTKHLWWYIFQVILITAALCKWWLIVCQRGVRGRVGLERALEWKLYGRQKSEARRRVQGGEVYCDIQCALSTLGCGVVRDVRPWQLKGSTKGCFGSLDWECCSFKRGMRHDSGLCRVEGVLSRVLRWRSWKEEGKKKWFYLKMAICEGTSRCRGPWPNFFSIH